MDVDNFVDNWQNSVDNSVDKWKNRQYICCCNLSFLSSLSFLNSKLFFKEKTYIKKESFFKNSYFFSTKLSQKRLIAFLTEEEVLDYSKTLEGKRVLIKIVREIVSKETEEKQRVYIQNEEKEEELLARVRAERAEEEERERKRRHDAFWDDFKKNRVRSKEESEAIQLEERRRAEEEKRIAEERRRANAETMFADIGKDSPVLKKGIYLRDVKLTKSIFRKIKAIFPDRENLTDLRILYFLKEILEQNCDTKLFAKDEKCFINFISSVIATKSDDFVDDDPYFVYVPVLENLGSMTFYEIEKAAAMNVPRIF